MDECMKNPSIISSETPKRIPTKGIFELTLRCNLHCKMCMFRHDDSENRKLLEDELTAGQWIDMARQAGEAGTLHLLITGGEPLIRPDFFNIWENIYKMGFYITLFTNATLVSPEVMKTLSKYPPHKIGVSLYGSNPETYESVTGSGEAFYRMVEGVDFLLTLPSDVEFRTTLINENFNDRSGMRFLVSDKFHAKDFLKISSPVYKAVRGGCSSVECHRIEPSLFEKTKKIETINNVKEFLGNDYREGQIIIQRKNYGTEFKNSEKKRPSFFGCDAGISRYTITYKGELIACQLFDIFSTSALKEGFSRAWESFPGVVEIDYTNEKCSQCNYVDYCQSCYGSRLAETGDFFGCSEYLYESAKQLKLNEIESI